MDGAQEIVPHPSQAWVGHPGSRRVDGVKSNRRSFDSSTFGELAQDDKSGEVKGNRESEDG
jgi:hypothetical protein